MEFLWLKCKVQPPSSSWSIQGSPPSSWNSTILLFFVSSLAFFYFHHKHYESIPNNVFLEFFTFELYNNIIYYVSYSMIWYILLHGMNIHKFFKSNFFLFWEVGFRGIYLKDPQRRPGRFEKQAGTKHFGLLEQHKEYRLCSKSSKTPLRISIQGPEMMGFIMNPLICAL